MVVEQLSNGNVLGFRAFDSDGLPIEPMVRATHGECQFCGATGNVIEMDNSAEEHPPYLICRACVGQLFDALQPEEHERDTPMSEWPQFRKQSDAS